MKQIYSAFWKQTGSKVTSNSLWEDLDIVLCCVISFSDSLSLCPGFLLLLRLCTFFLHKPGYGLSCLSLWHKSFFPLLLLRVLESLGKMCCFLCVGIPYMRQLWCLVRIHPASLWAAWISLTCGGVRLHLALPQPFVSCVCQGWVWEQLWVLCLGSCPQALRGAGCSSRECCAGPAELLLGLAQKMSQSLFAYSLAEASVSKWCLGSLKHGKVQVSSSLTKMLLLSPVKHHPSTSVRMSLRVSLTCMCDFLEHELHAIFCFTKNRYNFHLILLFLGGF